jgi:AsmA protein
MKAIKWVVLGVAVVIVLLLAVVLVLPYFINVQKYKPEIEKRISENLGLPVSIGGDLRLSLFPWAGVAFSELRVGNPPGFKEENLFFVKSFEVNVKVIPLLSRDIQVKGFILEGPRVVLEKAKNGKANWEQIGRASRESRMETPEEEKAGREESSADGFAVKSLAVGEMSVRNGSLLWVDGSKGERKEIKDLSLEVKDVSLDRPVTFMLTAGLEGMPVQVEGKVGPLGNQFMMGSVPLIVSVKAFKDLAVNLNGKVQELGSRPKFDLTLDVVPFSPRNIMQSLGKDFPVATTDPKAIGRVSLKCKIKGSTENVTISDGAIGLDDSTIGFSATLKDPAKPDLTFAMNIDRVDLDRYLPPETEKKSPGETAGKSRQKEERQERPDYSGVRKAVLAGEIRAGEMKMMGARLQNALLKIRGRDGVFHVDPFGFSAYEGTVSSKAEIDVRKDVPNTKVELDMTNVKARPLLNDVLKKDILDGTAKAKLALRMEGDTPDRIKKTLNGNGDLRFADGAIIGIDIPGMVRNLKSAFSASEKSAEKPKTDFAELTVPFSIKDGIVQTPGASLTSPLLRVTAEGTADLNQETLAMRVEPRAVASLKGQGDTKERSGLMVPILVTGTFSDPRFAPDLKGVLEKGLKEGLPSRSEIEGIIKGDPKKEGEGQNTKERLKDMLKGFGK